MSTEAQRVVVIQDASKDVSCGAIRGVLQSLSLKKGDELTLLAVLHQVNNPSTLAGKLCKNSYFCFPNEFKKLGNLLVRKSSD